MEIKCIKWKNLQYLVGSLWEFLPLKDGSRIYYMNRGGGMGFDFKQINMTSYLMGEEWVDLEADCEILLHGVAYFDGIRHLYFGAEESDNEGYFYYPRLESIKECLDKLRELEIKYCNQYE